MDPQPFNPQFQGPQGPPSGGLVPGELAPPVAFNPAPPIRLGPSPDSLPQRGYSIPQLTAYIQRQLGAPTWVVELPVQNIVDTINDSLALYSTWRPRWRFGAVPLARGQYRYLEGVDVGQGIVQVDFVQPNPVPIELFWGNLIDPAPLLRHGMDDLDSFLRWQKTWMRVTSVQPDWIYDDNEQVLWIYNPLDRYECGCQWYESYCDTPRLDNFGALWVKRYAFQKARHAYAELLSKYSGVIPGPIKDLQIDAGKRELAKVEMDKLEEELKAAQVSTPVQID